MDQDLTRDRVTPEVAAESSPARRRWFTLSLWVLMLVVLVVGGGIGWKVNRAHDQDRAVEAIRFVNGNVLYDYQSSFDRRKEFQPGRKTRSEPSAPTWLRKLVGDEYFQEVTSVTLREPATGPVIAVLEKLDHLERLSLPLNSKKGADLPWLARLTTLRAVNLSGGGVTDETLRILSGLPRLEEVGLSKVTVTDSGLSYLGDLRQMSSFSMSESQGISDGGIFGVLRNAPPLESLALDRMGITDGATAYFRQIPALKKLNLQGSRITDEGLANIGRLTQLDFLMVTGSTHWITDAGLANLRDLVNLKELFLVGDKLGDAGLARLEGLKNLERLDFLSTRATDAGLVHLAGLSKLKHLGLTRSKITDAGLARIAGLSKLENLSIGMTGVTDAGLAHLQNLKALKNLDVRDTRVTAEGLATLRSALPSLRIRSGVQTPRKVAPR